MKDILEDLLLTAMTLSYGVIAYRLYTQNHIKFFGFVWEFSPIWSIILSGFFAIVTLIMGFFTIKTIYLNVRYYFFDD